MCQFGDYWISQHVSPNDKSGPKESKGGIIFFLCNNKTSSDVHTRNAEAQINEKYDAKSAYSSRVVDIMSPIF